VFRSREQGAHLDRPHPHRPPALPHPLPTRRSSDLPAAPAPTFRPIRPPSVERKAAPPASEPGRRDDLARTPAVSRDDLARMLERSEEHTSELQSPYDIVCRLLLEKKKKRRRHPSLI